MFGDETEDKTYLAITDANGSIGTIRYGLLSGQPDSVETGVNLAMPVTTAIASWTVAAGTTGFDFSPTATALEQRTDLRGNNNVPGGDLFDYVIWSFPHNPLIRTNIPFRGDSAIQLNETVLPDVGIAAGVTLATVNTGLVTVDTGTFLTSTTGDATVANIYEGIKYLKCEPTSAQTYLEIPTANTMVATYDAVTLDFGARNLTLGGDLSDGTIETTGTFDVDSHGLDNITFDGTISNVATVVNGSDITSSGDLTVSTSSESEFEAAGAFTASGNLTDCNVTTTGTGNSITLNNRTILRGDFESADNIGLSGTQISGIGDLHAADNIRVNAASRVQDRNIRCENINGCEARSSFVRDNNYGPTTVTGGAAVCNINFEELDTLVGPLTLDDLLGEDWDFSAPGEVVLTSDAAVTIELDQRGVDELGLTLARGATTVVGLITYSFPASSVISTFTSPGSINGGNFALFHRTSPTDNWALNSRQTLLANVAGSISVVGAVGEYISVWKPLNDVTYANIRYESWTMATTPTMPLDYLVETLPIEEFVRSADPIPASVTQRVWTNPTGTDPAAGNLLLTIQGTSSGVRIGGGETQSLLRTLYSTQAYFDFIVDRVASTVSPTTPPPTLPIDVSDLAAVRNNLRFIFADSTTSTQANGDYIELTAGVPLVGNQEQQRLTAVLNSSPDPDTAELVSQISAVITGTAGAGMVSFNAVDIARNPEGISAQEVRDAVRTLTDALSDEHDRLSREHGIISQNQENNKVAIQRGAVKAAAYSAPALTDTDTGNVFP